MRPDPQREIRTFDRVYTDELPYVWSCLRSLGVAPQDLEDATQDVFVVVHRRLPEFRGEARLRTWLFSIAVRVASRRRRDGARAERRHRALATRGVDADGATDLEEAIARQRASARLERFAATLDADKRRVFDLWAFEGRSPQDIADALELPRNTVYSRLRVVRQSFSELCARHHARDEARMSPRHRRARDEAKLRIRAAIVAGPLAGMPTASQGSWWTRLGTLGSTRAIEVGAAIGLATTMIVALGPGAIEDGAPRRDATTMARASEASVTTRPAGDATEPVEPSRTDPVAAPVDAGDPRDEAGERPGPAPHAADEPSVDREASRRSLEPVTLSASTAAPEPSEPSLDRALVHIHAARDALAAGDPSAAEDALRRHAREFPHGPLEHEREAYAAMLACARGNVDLGRRFVAARPGTRLAQRVEAACAPRDRSTISTADGHEGSNEDPSLDSLGPLPRRRL